MIAELAQIILGVWIFVYVASRMDKGTRQAAILATLFVVGIKFIAEINSLWDFITFRILGG